MLANLTAGTLPSAGLKPPLQARGATTLPATPNVSEQSCECDDRLIESTTSLCSHCRQRVEARIVVKAGSVYLLKHCPVHGEELALLEKNAPYYLARLAYDKPGTASKIQTQIRHGCPFDCGLCPNH